MRTRICVGLTLGQISLLLLIALNVGLTQTAAPRRCRKRDKETGKCVAWRRGLAPRRKEGDSVKLGRYAQRRRTVRLERNPDFSRCAMVLNEQISGIPTAT